MRRKYLHVCGVRGASFEFVFAARVVLLGGGYCTDCSSHRVLQAETASVDADIQKEYARQREHLERSVASLRKKLTKDTEIHRADNVRIMQVSHAHRGAGGGSVTKGLYLPEVVSIMLDGTCE